MKHAAFRHLVCAFIYLSGGLSGLYSLALTYEIADEEPFYGYSPVEIRRMMVLPICLELFWLCWCISIVYLIFRRRIHEYHTFLILWAILCAIALGSGINQYASDISVLESPNREILI